MNNLLNHQKRIKKVYGNQSKNKESMDNLSLFP